MNTDLQNIPNTPPLIISDGSKILDAIYATLFFLSICWSLYFLDHLLGYNLRSWALVPRELQGLKGIVGMHFLHGSLSHLWHNTLSFAVLNTILFYFYRSISLKTFFTILFFGAVLLWLIGRPTAHIGASLLIYGEFSFLFFSGILRKNPSLMRVTLTVALFYGSIIWYLFPIDPVISWEGHIGGFISGIFAAVLYRRQGPADKVYQFQLEPEEEPEEPLEEKLQEEEVKKNTPLVSVRYHYKEKDQS